MNRGPASQTALLACHPDRSSDAVGSIEVRLRRADAAAIALTCVLEGDLARIRIPPRAAPRRADGLWRHTCFEVFIAPGDGPGYFEFNFAPSGEWAAYAFRSYREDAAFECDVDPRIAVTIGEGSLQLDATVFLAALHLAPDARLRMGLSAVIEEETGSLTYWALTHPPGPPDFHHSDAFALQVAL